MQVFALPEMQLVFSFTHPSEGPSLMRSRGSCRSSSGGQTSGEALHVQEVALHSFGTSVKSREPAAAFLIVTDLPLQGA